MHRFFVSKIFLDYDSKTELLQAGFKHSVTLRWKPHFEYGLTKMVYFHLKYLTHEIIFILKLSSYFLMEMQ